MKMKRLISLAIALLLVCSLPVSAFAAEYDLALGSVTVNASESWQTVTHGTNAAVPDSAPVITQSNSSTPTTNTVTINAAENATANVTIQDVNIVIRDPEGSPQNHSGQAAVTIDVADGAKANVTLDDVKIDVGGTGGEDFETLITYTGEAAVQIRGNGDVTLELDGKNTVQSGINRAGVEKNTIAPTNTDPGSGNGKLTITDENGASGSLEATGVHSGAGIGGGRQANGSNITIEGGAEVTAKGGDYGAGIGGGYGGSGSNITITDSAEVRAQGGFYGSGIGGGAYGSGSDITITGSAEVRAKGGTCGAGIGGGNLGSGSNIEISGSAEVTAQGGHSGAGIGGGYGGSGISITISGGAEVTTKGGDYGAGIGGGLNGSGSVITVSENAQVKAQGGKDFRNSSGKLYYGAGAAIGDGGKDTESNPNDPYGAEVKPDTNALNEGWIATYAPGTTDLNTVPKSLTYKDNNGNLATSDNAVPFAKQEPTCTEDGYRAGFTVNGTQVGGEKLQATGHSFTNYVSNNDATYDSDGTKTAECDRCDATHTIPDPGSKLVREEVPQTTPLYRVIGQDGKDIPHQAERKDGVLTVTVDADFASLTGSLGGINALKKQGIDTIVFVTKGASSTFALADLLAQGSAGDSYTLTHDGEAVSFTLNNETDIGKILK